MGKKKDEAEPTKIAEVFAGDSTELEILLDVDDYLLRRKDIRPTLKRAFATISKVRQPDAVRKRAEWAELYEEFRKNPRV